MSETKKKTVSELEAEMRSWQTRKKRQLAEARLREELERREAAEARVGELEREVQQLRAEIARLRQPAQQVQRSAPMQGAAQVQQPRPAVHGAGAPRAE